MMPKQNCYTKNFIRTTPKLQNEQRIMNIKTTIAAILLMLTASHIGAKNKQIREVENFNLEWTYMRGDAEGAEMKNVDDSSWEKIGPPHSLSIP